MLTNVCTSEGEWFAKYYNVQNYAVHENYNPRKLMGRSVYDLALVKLEDHIFWDSVNHKGSKTMLGVCRWNVRIERFVFPFFIIISVQNPTNASCSVTRVGIPGQPIHGPSMDHRMPIDGPSMVRRPFLPVPWLELLELFTCFCRLPSKFFMILQYSQRNVHAKNFTDSI